MLSLVEIQRLSYEDLLTLLVRLPQSKYFGDQIVDLELNLSKGDAIRYLSILSVLNEKERSKLSSIDEVAELNDSNQQAPQDPVYLSDKQKLYRSECLIKFQQLSRPRGFDQPVSFNQAWCDR